MSTRDHPDWWRPMGGQNSQDSTLERRSLIWNDDGIEDGTVPGDISQAGTFEGKFFTRGCRGKIEQLQLYCIGDGADSITLRYSPHPCIGPLGEVVIIPAAAWAWQAFVIEEMWNYDSLFIWVYACEGNVSWAFDAVEPFDGHESGDAGATWADMAIRPFIRAVYTGETPGDVPVSGIVNVIDIPSIASRRALVGTVNVLNDVYTDIAEVEGAGTLLEAAIVFYTSVAPTAGLPPAAVTYRIQIRADGAVAYYWDNRKATQSETLTAGRCSKGVFWQATVADPEYDRTNLITWLPIKFRRSLQIRAYQSTGGAVTAYGDIEANLIR